MYVPLRVHSNFTFLEGASHPEELIPEARRLGLPALALTDRDGVHGAVRAFSAAREHGVRLLHGSELTVFAKDSRDLPAPDRRAGVLTTEQLATLPTETPVVLATDRTGWGHLCRLITIGRRRCGKGRSLLTWDDLAAHAGGLLLLVHDRGTPAVAPVAGPIELFPSRAPIAAAIDAFAGRTWALLQRHCQADDTAHERDLRERARHFGWPLLAGTCVRYHTPARRPLQDVLTCIRHGVTLHGAGRLIAPNAEHALLSPFAFQKRFADLPDAVARTLDVAERCSFDLGQLRYRYPAQRLPDGTTQEEWLRHLVLDGARGRGNGVIPTDVASQIDKELALIGKLDYGGYFLSMWEIVQFCKSRGILCQGRGSAANSVVCYALGITAIDPVRMGLLFERFLSFERAEPPDIDLDIEHDRREEVIQHVYGLFDPQHAAAQESVQRAPNVTESQPYAAMVAVVIRYRTRSALRDVGKVLGLHETELDRLSKLAARYADGIDEATLRAGGFDPETPAHQLLMKLSSEIQDFPRHLSVHPGGFLLGHEPVDTLVPVENAAMERRTVIQWDKDDVDTLGLFKVDLLGLGMLSQVHRCFDLLRLHRGLDLTMATVPAEDPATYAMIQRADTVGVFQIESRAQMSMLPRLKPRTFYDLVIEVAIIRPGPITGGMVHPYLRRRDGLEAVDFAHPCLEPVLAKTLGIPLFQEQVMKLAMVAADYTPGEADQLRRDMAAWKRSGRLEKHREKLVGRMVAKGIDEGFASRVFEQIKGFGEYGFPESHAASFALISYVTSWLKCHHPTEFACALLNAWPMGFYTPATIVDDAKRHGVEVRAIDVNASQWECTVELRDAAEPHASAERERATDVGALRMGLRYVQGLGELQRVRLEEAGANLAGQGGLYADVADFVRRTRLDRRALVALAEAGAFDGLGVDRRTALWQVRAEAQRSKDTLALDRSGEALPLFRALSGHEEVIWDWKRAGHSPRGHPLTHLRERLRAQGLPTAAEVARIPTGRRGVRYVGLVICRQRPGTAKGVTFFTLEDETGFVNLVVWRDVFEQFHVLAKTAGLLGVTGKVQAEAGVVHVVVEQMWVPEVAAVECDGRSRDFH
ncbi:MAG: DNA polymerase III subunit alpha [Myxococcales bacterium]|nr:DNA polymerase III subunit alpha [Myxococcales bacterium]